MAFKHFPRIDEASMNSGGSENALEGFFSQRNGFICRKEYPDKGCDYDTELIVDQTNAYNWRFGIQLKSVENITVVGDRELISYSFKTSRLNYLLNRPAADGLIVIYNDETGIAYYEYALQIYLRLSQERGSDHWQDKEKVNIHVRVKNVLDKESVRSIHQQFFENFNKVVFMVRSQGARYDTR